MAVRPARSRRTSGSPRRQFQWARLRKDVALAAGAAVDRQDMLSAWLAEVGLTASLGFTVMRVRGLISIVTATAGDEFRVAAVRRYERGVAAAAADGPYDTEHDDWFLWEPFFAPIALTGTATTDSVHRVVDVKASRRMTEARHELQLWCASPATNAGAATLHYDLSVGVKLP